MKRCEFENKIDGYLLDKLSEKEKDEFEKHYFNCPICSKELIFREKIFEAIKEKGSEIFADVILETYKPIKISPFNKILYFFKVKKLALAFTIISLIILASGSFFLYHKLTHPGFFPPSEEIIRGEVITLLYPHGELRKYPKYFYWKRIEGNPEYLLCIFDNKNNLVWKVKTKNNRVKLPNKIKNTIKKENFYFWEVNAFSSQGSIIGKSRRGIFRII